MCNSQARKSPNRPPADKVLDNLIYNYNPTFSGKTSKSFEEVYIFSWDGSRRGRVFLNQHSIVIVVWLCIHHTRKTGAYRFWASCIALLLPPYWWALLLFVHFAPPSHIHLRQEHLCTELNMPWRVCMYICENLVPKSLQIWWMFENWKAGLAQLIVECSEIDLIDEIIKTLTLQVKGS